MGIARSIIIQWRLKHSYIEVYEHFPQKSSNKNIVGHLEVYHLNELVSFR